MVALIAVVVALFPVVFVVSSAFNRDNTLVRRDADPDARDAAQLRQPAAQQRLVPSGNGKADAPYLSWILNSMIVAGATALLTTMLGALAAYAFSRFRFKGRRMGMMTLLLIQMFPQFGAIAAIYLLVLNVGDIFHPIGLNTLLGVIVVYLGGAMGVQAWLMKGFFDTIPKELDESARVDGATAAQIFWGVVLPLAAPVLVVVALISFVFTLNEFVIASALLQTNDHFTLAGRHAGLHQPAVRPALGAVRGGLADGDDPGDAALPLPAALDRQRAHRRQRQGMSIAPARLGQLLLEPHHDGSELHVLEQPDALGGDATVRVRTARGAADRVLLRYARDGEPRTIEAMVDEETEHETWWRATFPVCEPGDALPLAARPAATTGYGWLTGNGLSSHEVPSSDDFVMSLGSWPGLAPRRRSSTRSSPTASRRRVSSAPPPTGPSPARGASHRPAVGRRLRASGTAATWPASSSISTTSSRSVRTPST